MELTATYRSKVFIRLKPVSAAIELVRQDISLPSPQADEEQGDGGVDVTGAPKSRSVEGADFGRLFCLSVGKRSHWDRILAEVQVDNRFTWGLQFLSRFVFAQVNARLL